jgi:hypothetical protein
MNAIVFILSFGGDETAFLHAAGSCRKPIMGAAQSFSA